MVEGAFAYDQLEPAHRRARDHAGTRVIALEADDQDVLGGVGSVRATRARVIGEAPVIPRPWPRIPGQTIDLEPVAAAIEQRSFRFLLRGSGHDVAHWQATASAAGRLIRARSRADADVVAAFALLHDADERHDDQDGRRVAVWTRELQAAGVLDLDDRQVGVLARALDDYPPRTSRDPTVAVCWDACRLASDVIVPVGAFSTGLGRAAQRARLAGARGSVRGRA